MTKDRLRKAEIRAQKAITGLSYLATMRQLSDPAASTPATQVEVLPPLAAWARPTYCTYWGILTDEHGPLMALTIKRGTGWWDLDDMAREVAGASQDRPAAQRGLWLATPDGRYTVTKREHLAGIIAKLDAAGALSRLTVRSLPNGASCSHASCRRRRAEPLASTRTRNAPSEARAAQGKPVSVVSLDEVIEQHAHLGRFGFGVPDAHRKTPEERRQALEAGREELRRQQVHIVRVRDWLLANITPIKTPTVGSYHMKHVVEDAFGSYVANGELIAAALMAGYPVGRRYGPNVALGMSKRDVDRVRTTR
jgi:hypothetical protein